MVNDESEKKEFVFADESRRLRIDIWVHEQIPNLSRTAVQNLIKEGRITVNGSRTKPNHKLVHGEKISASIPPPGPVEPTAQPIPLDIIYEDADIIAVNKPAGMIVHPAAGISENTLVNALLDHCENLSMIGGVERPGIVHRLDKDTSGIMLVAKNNLAHEHISEQLADRTVRKMYLCFFIGSIRSEELIIDEPIGRNPNNRKLMGVNPEDGRCAITEINVLADFSFVTFAAVFPRTGRTHQIRVHLAHVNHPVVGDIQYGYSLKDLKNRVPPEYKTRSGLFSKVKRQLLHSYKITFLHPTSHEKIELKAKLPADFQIILDQFDIPGEI